jgi:2-polyprenyl-3-methyl-5-hydroxy-6-metoxy-1,4-benzoquinol methylase
MVHPGQEWYEESDIYEEVRWNLPAVSRLGERWEFARALEPMVPHASVFDVGCGRGDFLKLAQTQSFDVAGIDLHRTLVRVGHEAYGLSSIEQGTIEDYRARHPEKKFDAVTAFEVLEHVSNPREFLRACGSLLKPHGLLIVSVPGYQRWPRWVNNEVDLPPHHFVLWSQTALKKILMAEGFKDVRTEQKPLLLTDIMYHVVRWFPWLQKPGVFRKLARGVLKAAVYPVWSVVRFFPRAGGFTILAIGTKQ